MFRNNYHIFMAEILKFTLCQHIYDLRICISIVTEKPLNEYGQKLPINMAQQSHAKHIHKSTYRLAH